MKHQTKNLALLSEHHLNAYTVAAAAAGVGALCLGPAAEAKVVYTPANVKIVQNGGLFAFDLNHDGIADFGLSNRHKSISSQPYGELRGMPNRRANEIWEATPSSGCAAALPRGTKIGANGLFKQDYPAGKVMAVASLHQTNSCPWNSVKQAYLGLKFNIKGKTHFGWARVKVSIAPLGTTITAILTGYAYETTPGKPIIAGATKGPNEQAGSLGALAAGAVGR